MMPRGMAAAGIGGEAGNVLKRPLGEQCDEAHK